MPTDDDRVTMADYHDGEPDTPPSPPTTDADPYTCEHCGRSYAHLGVRASKALRKHQDFHGCPEADDA